METERSKSEELSNDVWPNLDTCLSHRVKNLNSYCLSLMRESHSPDVSVIGRLLDGLPISDHFFANIMAEKLSLEYFREAVGLIAPLVSCTFQAAQNDYAMHKQDSGYLSARYGSKLEWTGHGATLTNCLEMCLASDSSEHHALLALQLVSVQTERALGDILITAGHRCPALLKGILAHPGLPCTIGTDITEILAVLIGPPTSFNFRNLVWHGFLSPTEAVPELPVFLILLLVAVGARLTKKNLSVILRKKKAFPHIICQNFPFVSVDERRKLYDGAEKLLQKSFLIADCCRMLWQCVVLMFRDDRTWFAVHLLLPQIEAVLRVVYAVTNGQPERVLTAEDDQLFLTLDQIFSRDTGTTENKLRNFLGDQLLGYFLDLFIYPEGPRIRHRISHGEYQENCIDSITGDLLLLGGICVLLRAEKSVAELALLNANQWIRSYAVQFHPVGMLKSVIGKFTSELDNMQRCSLLQEYSREEMLSGICQIAFDNASRFCAEKTVIFPVDTYRLDSLNQAHWIHVFVIMAAHSFPSVFRPDSEIRVTKLCTLIWKHMTAVVENIQNYLELSSERLRPNGELPSQHIRPYLRMLKILPQLMEKLFLTALFLFGRLYGLQNKAASETAALPEKQIKLFKKILQSWENIVSLSKANVNEFVKVESWLVTLGLYLIRLMDDSLL